MLNHRCVKCGKLMFKSSHLQGHVQVMCPRCKKLNEIRFVKKGALINVTKV